MLVAGAVFILHLDK